MTIKMVWKVGFEIFMKSKIFLIFLLLTSGFRLYTGHSDVGLNPSIKKGVTLVDENKELKQPSCFCEHKTIAFLCVPALCQAFVLCVEKVFVKQLPFYYTSTREEVLMWKAVSLAACALALPYGVRYCMTGDMRPTCLSTALFIPTFFVEIPYIVHQRRNYAKKLNCAPNLPE
jgi:hypothetical protein